MVSLTIGGIMQNYVRWKTGLDYWVILPISIAGLVHHMSTAAISIVYHRGATHGAVELDPRITTYADNLVQFIAWVNLDEWKPAHETHHRHADTLKDPHSPKNDGLFLMLLDPFIRYNQKIKALIQEWIIDPRLTNTPIQKLLFPVLTANAYIWTFGNMNGLIAILASYGLLKWAAWTVNWLGHNHETKRREYGKSFAQNIGENPKGIIGNLKSILLNFLTAGEHHHGNHHLRPTSADISLWWSTGFDIWFFYIQVLEKLWLAKILWNFDREGKISVNKGIKVGK